MTSRRATRDDVARLAGTSAAVVSYVVNGGPRGVSAELADRVRAAMSTLDYVPNALARSLGGTRTRTVGMIVPNISNAYFSELALAVENVVAETGRLLFLGNSNEDPRRELAYLRTFVERRVDGIVLIGVTRSSTLEAARQAGLPVVVVDRDLDQQLLPTVSIDHRAAARAATEHLIQHGHTRIACLAGPDDLPVAAKRLAGWRDVLRASVGADEGPVLRSKFSLAGGRECADGVIEAMRQGASAVFVSSDDQARGLLAGVHDRGIAVPEELALASVDGTREGFETSPRLTSVRQPYNALAAAAIEAMSATETTTGHVHVDARLTIGRSCGCRPDEEN